MANLKCQLSARRRREPAAATVGTQPPAAREKDLDGRVDDEGRAGSKWVQGAWLATEPILQPIFSPDEVLLRKVGGNCSVRKIVLWLIWAGGTGSPLQSQSQSQ